MPKKTYSIRLDENLMSRLEFILENKKISKTAFIEDYLVTYLTHIEASLKNIPIHECPDCHHFFGGVVNCPYCKKTIA